jgi:hypothetical protein
VWEGAAATHSVSNGVRVDFREVRDFASPPRLSAALFRETSRRCGISLPLLQDSKE